MKFELQRVEFMPKTLEPGVLYYASDYGTAAHLCACGCGSKIRTPIDTTEWAIEEDEEGPTLFPSIGNWQKPCRSHYLITNGEVIWCGAWTEEEIQQGRRLEHERRLDYITTKYPDKKGLWSWLRKWLGRCKR